MKKIYIHCGLHKTGTTSLQHALKQNASVLLNHHIFYPNVGMPGKNPGHHNLAWQLSRDRRFDHRLGDWSSFFSRLESFEGTVVLSSEDFESSLLKPKRWAEVVPLLKKKGFELVFLVYLRDPMSYLESLYIENLKDGCGDEFLNVFNNVCERGKFIYKEYEFCFDYALISSSISSIKDVGVVFRNYDNLFGGSIVNDFMSLMGVDDIFTEKSESDLMLNKRSNLQTSLKWFVRNRNWSWFRNNNPESIYRAVDALCLGKTVKLMAPPELKKIFNRRFIKSIEFISDTDKLVLSSPQKQSVIRSARLEENLLHANMQICKEYSHLKLTYF